MKKYSCLCVMVWCSAMHVAAQSSVTLKGKIVDATDSTVLELATVTIRQVKDSSLITYTLTDEKGFFSLDDVPAGKAVRLNIFFTGYERYEQLITVPQGNKIYQAGTLALHRLSRSLEGVTIQGERPPIAIRKDTIEFDATAFKTRPNAVVEDLLKKLPGVDVDKDGNITVNGKKVSRVLVDGKNFFGNDPKLATKNLPSDIIEKVQVTDTKTKEEEFTGKPGDPDDKTINVTLKKDKKKGWFGRATAGGGSDRRYDASGLFNYFNGPMQLSLLGFGNNINKSAFSMNEIMPMMQGQYRTISVNQGGGFAINGLSFGGMGNGIIDTKGGGVNFNDDLGKKLKLSGSYFYNNSLTDNATKTRRENALPDSVFTYNSQSNSHSRSENHRVNMNLEYNPDSTWRITDLPNFNVTYSHSDEEDSTLTAGGGGKPINQGSSIYTSNSTEVSFSNSFYAGKKFRKKGRNLSFNFNTDLSRRNTNAGNTADNFFYPDNSPAFDSSLRQRSTMLSNTASYFLSLAYSEPVSEALSISLSYGFNVSYSKTNKQTYNLDPVSGKYDQPDATYSDQFRSTFLSQTPSLSLDYNTKKIRASLGLKTYLNQLDNYIYTSDLSLHQSQVNISPNMRFNYDFGKNRSLSLYYSSYMQQPSIDQLQPVPDNSNTLYIKEGNPDLKPAFTQYIQAGYNMFDMKSGNNFFSSIYFDPIYNKIVNEVRYDSLGRQVSKYVNANGTYNIGTNFNFSKGKKKNGNDWRITAGAYIYYTKDITFTNGIPDHINGWSINPRLSYSYSYKDLFDIAPSYRPSYHSSKYAVSSFGNTSYFTHYAMLSTTLYWPQNFIWGNDLSYTYNTNVAPGFQKGAFLWNISLSRQFFKNKQGELKFSVYDLLDQNISVNRQVTQNYIQDTQTKILRRYFMLSFTYNLYKFGQKPATRKSNNRMFFF